MINGAGVKQYVQLTGRGLVGVRASDGKFLWRYNPVANDVANIPTPVVKGDWVFASTGYQTGSAPAQARQGRRRRRRQGGLLPAGQDLPEPPRRPRPGRRPPLRRPRPQPRHADLRRAGDRQGGLGRRGHPADNGGTGSAAVTAADGHLYFRYQNGQVVLIEATPAGYRQKGAFEHPDVDRPSWSHPVIARRQALPARAGQPVRLRREAGVRAGPPGHKCQG